MSTTPTQLLETLRSADRMIKHLLGKPPADNTKEREVLQQISAAITELEETPTRIYGNLTGVKRYRPKNNTHFETNNKPYIWVMDFDRDKCYAEYVDGTRGEESSATVFGPPFGSG